MPYARVSTIQYKPGKMKEVVRQVEQELLAVFHKEPGFLWYKLTVDDHDKGTAMTCWETREQADAGMKEISRWVDERFADWRLSSDTWLGEVKIEDEAASTGAAVVEAIYDAFNARDFDRIAKLITPDAKILNVPTRQELGLIDDMKAWLSGFNDGKIEVTSVLQSGRHVISEYIGRGTHNGTLPTPAGPIAATNKWVELKFVEIAELREGKVARVRAYFDTGDLARQLGLAPQPTIPAPAKGAPARPEVRH